MPIPQHDIIDIKLKDINEMLELVNWVYSYRVLDLLVTKMMNGMRVMSLT